MRSSGVIETRRKATIFMTTNATIHNEINAKIIVKNQPNDRIIHAKIALALGTFVFCGCARFALCGWFSRSGGRIRGPRRRGVVKVE